jgi:ribonuclease P protein component
MATPSRVSRADFGEVFKKTKPHSTPGLRLRYLPSPTTSAAFVVSSKTIKTAAGRNLIKRRGRAIFQKIKNRSKKGKYLFFFQTEAKNLSFNDLQKLITVLLVKARLIDE